MEQPDPKDAANDGKVDLPKANKVRWGFLRLLLNAAGVAQALQRATAKIKQGKSAETDKPPANMLGAYVLS